MKIVQSLWTGTAQFRVSRELLLLHTLSVCQALKHFSQVELVTDDRGLAISELLGWKYTSYSNVLDECSRAGLTNQWAAGKMFALLEQNRPCVHVDNDALLFGHFFGRMLRAPLIAERVDNPWHYRSPDAVKAREALRLLPGAVPYNCGLVGGADVRLVRKYAERAIELALSIRGTALNGTVCSMAFEQYWLGDFSRREGVRVETILPAQASLAQARRARYLHLTGGIKLFPSIVSQVEKRMAREFPDAYRLFKEGWPRVAQLEHENTFVVNPYG